MCIDIGSSFRKEFFLLFDVRDKPFNKNLTLLFYSIPSHYLISIPLSLVCHENSGR